MGHLIGTLLPIRRHGLATALGVVVLMAVLGLVSLVPVVGDLVVAVLILSGVGGVLVTYHGVAPSDPNRYLTDRVGDLRDTGKGPSSLEASAARNPLWRYHCNTRFQIMSKTSRWLAYGALVLAAGLVAKTLLGPLFTGTIQYHYGETLTNQGIAVDAVALFAAVPIVVAAALLSLRGHVAGPVLSSTGHCSPPRANPRPAPMSLVTPSRHGLTPPPRPSLERKTG